MKKTLLLIGLLLFATTAFAVPNLQIYIPGGTFDNATETWISPDPGTFEVWVLAGNLSSTDIIYDIGLVASLGANADPLAGSMTITPAGGSDVTYNGSDFAYGTPPDDHALPSHGIFPAWHIDHMVTAQTSTNSADWEDIYDMPTGGGPTDGQIFRFTITTTFDYLHFDAYGYQTKKNGDDKRIFAPFSHDGESGGKTPPEVPEPATMLLFGLGIAGATIAKKIRK